MHFCSTKAIPGGLLRCKNTTRPFSLCWPTHNVTVLRVDPCLWNKQENETISEILGVKTPAGSHGRLCCVMTSRRTSTVKSTSSFVMHMGGCTRNTWNKEEGAKWSPSLRWKEPENWRKLRSRLPKGLASSRNRWVRGVYSCQDKNWKSMYGIAVRMNIFWTWEQQELYLSQGLLSSSVTLSILLDLAFTLSGEGVLGNFMTIYILFCRFSCTYIEEQAAFADHNSVVFDFLPDGVHVFSRQRFVRFLKDWSMRVDQTLVKKSFFLHYVWVQKSCWACTSGRKVWREKHSRNQDLTQWPLFQKWASPNAFYH